MVYAEALPEKGTRLVGVGWGGRSRSDVWSGGALNLEKLTVTRE